jgi:hypothetical protein
MATRLEEMLTALRQQLKTVSGLPARAWENQHTEPDPTVPFVADFIGPSTTERIGCGVASPRRTDASYQVHVHVPVATDVFGAMAHATRIQDAFDAAGEFPIGASAAYVQSVSVQTLPKAGDFYRVAAVIDFTYDHP